MVSPDTCRPFSRDRRGLILGEGAAMLVLEPLEAARARGAQIWGEIAGFGMSSDAHHLTQPLAEGAARPCEPLLRMPARVRRNPSATSTLTAPEPSPMMLPKPKPSARSSAPHADQLLVSSTKSMHGHALGAAGALEAAATLAAHARRH